MLSSCTFFYFFVEDEERAAVNHERKLGKEALGGGRGGGVGNARSKGVYPEEDILIAASSNGERDESSLQCNPASSSMRLPFLTVRLLSLSSK